MCDFNALDDAAKQAYHDQLTACAEAFGGTNFFLQLLEAIRKTKPHPLTAKNGAFRSPVGSVTWSKTIFQDKMSLLTEMRVGEGKRGNFLPEETDRRYKKVLNLVRTLAPITFEVKPKRAEDGEGFTLHPFDRVSAKTTLLNPLFDALFFCSVETVKKVLNYKGKTA